MIMRFLRRFNFQLKSDRAKEKCTFFYNNCFLYVFFSAKGFELKRQKRLKIDEKHIGHYRINLTKTDRGRTLNTYLRYL